MSVVERNWQTTRPTIRERSKFMFNNNLFSDVKFVVQKAAQGKSENKQVIPAHKFVLSISSPVFEAMFYGELAETTDSIELPDCEYDSLLELFRYMYSDEVILSGSNVMGVLYLAKKYMVPSLADKCMKYLQDNLDPSNVFSILPSAQKFEEKKLVDRCWKLISKQTDEALKSECLETIERSLLEAVVKRDNLNVEEIELFKAVDLWATKECEKQGLAADGKAKRRILGEEIIKAIRFPIMDEKDFASVVLDSKILTKEEIVSVLKLRNSVPSPSKEFSKTKRSGSEGDIQRCCRFNSLSGCGLKADGPSIDHNIIFSVNRDIKLLGVCLFGSENNTYSVELKVRALGNSTVLALRTGQFSSELLQGEKFNYFGFKVLFDSVILKRNTEYHVGAKVTGPNSACGDNGDSTVTCSGVTFTFLDIEDTFASNLLDRLRNITTVQPGQFPALLFTL